MTFKTFKANIIMSSAEDTSGKTVVQEGLMWHSQLGNPIMPTIDVSHELFELTEEEILFSQEQLNKYGDGLRLDPFDTRFHDEIKYTLHKHYKRGKPIYQIKIGNYELNLKMTLVNKFILNVIHNRYWLFNEKKWFVTFIISLSGLILAIIALAVGG